MNVRNVDLAACVTEVMLGNPDCIYVFPQTWPDTSGGMQIGVSGRAMTDQYTIVAVRGGMGIVYFCSSLGPREGYLVEVNDALYDAIGTQSVPGKRDAKDSALKCWVRWLDDGCE